MPYAIPVAPAHTEAGPVITPAPDGAEFIPTALLDAVPLLHPLVGVTDTLPPRNPNETVTDVLPFPAVMDAPDGTLQLYPVAPVTVPMVNTLPVELLHTEDGPDTAPAAPMLPAPPLTLMAEVFGVPLPQVLDGVTVILPLLDPKVTLMLRVPWPELIVVPDGTVHV